jgi:hypothetical protein
MKKLVYGTPMIDISDLEQVKEESTNKVFNEIKINHSEFIQQTYSESMTDSSKVKVMTSVCLLTSREFVTLNKIIEKLESEDYSKGEIIEQLRKLTTETIYL